MKNENTAFGLLSAIILAGVIAACVPSADARNATKATSGLDALTAYVAAAADNPQSYWNDDATTANGERSVEATSGI